jgi:hypothetical protein
MLARLYFCPGEQFSRMDTRTHERKADSLCMIVSYSFFRCDLCQQKVRDIGEHRGLCKTRLQTDYDAIPDSSLYSCTKCATPLKLWPKEKLVAGTCFKCLEVIANSGENLHSCFLCDKQLCGSHNPSTDGGRILVNFEEREFLPEETPGPRTQVPRTPGSQGPGPNLLPSYSDAVNSTTTSRTETFYLNEMATNLAHTPSTPNDSALSPSPTPSEDIFVPPSYASLHPTAATTVPSTTTQPYIPNPTSTSSDATYVPSATSTPSTTPLPSTPTSYTNSPPSTPTPSQSAIPDDPTPAPDNLPPPSYHVAMLDETED